jgi:MFS family permease
LRTVDGDPFLNQPDRKGVPVPAPHRIQLGRLLAHTVVVQALTFMLGAASTYRALDLDVPSAWLGILGASFAVVPLVLAVPSGQAVDRFGDRRIMQGSWPRQAGG